jgi:2-oxoglutarate ferredoxin oxidoreductase subunit alpha
VALTSMTLEALKEFDISKKEAERAKNMFALGLMSWLYHRPTEGTVAFLQRKFKARPLIAEANVTAFKAGYNFGETTEVFAVSYQVKPAKLRPGTYRTISGNLALAYGLIAASRLSGLPLFLGAYPITPASDILHELSKHKAFGVRTFQAEDEIAGVGAAGGGDQRPRHRPEGRDHRPGGLPRAAPAGDRHPAQRPVDRHAHQDRAVRPAAGDVRPQR